MKIKELSKEELEALSYSELAEMILNEKGTAMKIVDIFKKICKLRGLSDAEFESKIVDFFEVLSTDKSFIMLEKGKCDLSKKHDIKVVIEEEEEEEPLESIVADEEKEEKDDEEDIFYDNSSEEDDIEDGADEDELSNFIVVEDDEEASI